MRETHNDKPSDRKFDQFSVKDTLKGDYVKLKRYFHTFNGIVDFISRLVLIQTSFEKVRRCRYKEK